MEQDRTAEEYSKSLDMKYRGIEDLRASLSEVDKVENVIYETLGSLRARRDACTGGVEAHRALGNAIGLLSAAHSAGHVAWVILDQARSDLANSSSLERVTELQLKSAHLEGYNKAIEDITIILRNRSGEAPEHQTMPEPQPERVQPEASWYGDFMKEEEKRLTDKKIKAYEEESHGK